MKTKKQLAFYSLWWAINYSLYIFLSFIFVSVLWLSLELWYIITILLISVFWFIYSSKITFSQKTSSNKFKKYLLSLSIINSFNYLSVISIEKIIEVNYLIIIWFNTIIFFIIKFFIFKRYVFR